MMTQASDSTVIELATHPVWRSSRRNSRELAEAMRRHPSSYRLEAEEPAMEHSGGRTDGRVIALACVRALRQSL